MREFLRWAEKKLKNKSASALLDAEVLLSFALKKPKEFIFAHPEKKINKEQGAKFENLVNRRAKREPVAYLTGQKEFYGLDFKVNKNVLIPRPETELMIDFLITTLRETPAPQMRSGGTEAIPNFPAGTQNCRNRIIIDVGTGSGCLAVIAAKIFPQTKIIAVDISPAALKIAGQNARLHGVANRIKFLRGNLLKPFINKITKYQNNKTTIYILANLPYLTTRQWRRAPPDVRLYEPRLALDAGPDGLKHFRELFRQIKQPLAAYDLRLTAFLEIDPSQSVKIQKLAGQFFPRAKMEIKKDLAGKDRVAVIGPPPSQSKSFPD